MSKTTRDPNFYFLITTQDGISVSVQSLRTKIQPDLEKSENKKISILGADPKPEVEINQCMGGFVAPMGCINGCTKTCRMFENKGDIDAERKLKYRKKLTPKIFRGGGWGPQWYAYGRYPGPQQTCTLRPL